MNLLITGAWKCSEEELNILKSMGHQIVYMNNEKDILPCDYSWVEGTICNGLFLYHPIEKFLNLKYIQLTSAGLDRVPLDYIKENNIEIHNAKGVYSIPMAEFVICGVLQLYKKSRFFNENQKQHKWEKCRNLLELSGKTVVIVGCGSVGTECAKRFSAFGCKVVGVDIEVREDDCYFEIVELSKLNDVLAIADIVVLTLPLTNETHHLINKERLNLMKDSSILVNIARGGVVDTEALINKLPKLSGAVLDVFEDEPLDEKSPLWDMKNVIITPHNSFVGDGNQYRLLKLITEMGNENDR